jgi:hypothetical protein
MEEKSVISRVLENKLELSQFQFHTELEPGIQFQVWFWNEFWFFSLKIRPGSSPVLTNPD